jgi:hypothetical protein
MGDEAPLPVRPRLPERQHDWGKDAADPRNAIYEGRPDPVAPGYTGNAIARCLAGTGPTSWSLNGKESGVYDLVGNAWEWVDMLIGTAADHTIDAGYPGAGLTLPTANGNITTLYAPAKDGNRSLAADAFSPATVGSARAEYDNDYYWQATGQRAAIRGGIGTMARLWTVLPERDNAPSNANTHRLPRSLLIWKSGDLHGTTARASENLAEIVRPGEGSDAGD